MPSESPQDNGPIFPETEPRENREQKNLKGRLLDLYYNAMPLFTINIAWFLLSLPVVTILPSLGGLYYAVLHYNQHKDANWGTYWEGFKKHWLSSLKLGAITLVVDLVLALNIWISINTEEVWSPYTLTIGVVVAVIWFTMSQFSFPLFMIQEEKSVRVAIRNSYVIVFRRPWDAVKVVLLNLVFTIVSIFIPPLWFFLTMSLITHLQTRTTLSAVEKIRAQDAERDAADAQETETDPDKENNN